MNVKGNTTLEKLKNILRVKNYSLNTINNYIYHVREFIKYNTKETYSLNVSDLNIYLQEYKYSSISQQNQIISSLKLFYLNVYFREEKYTFR